MQVVSRCLGREPPNRRQLEEEKRGIVTRSRCTFRWTPEWKFDWIPSRRGRKRPSVTGNGNLADRMDEDNFRRGPATSHQLEPVDDENGSKKARVARNVLHVRGEDSVKFDVNEKAWPNADLVIRLKLRRCLDRRTARRTKSRLAMNEKSSR